MGAVLALVIVAIVAVALLAIMFPDPAEWWAPVIARWVLLTAWIAVVAYVVTRLTAA